MNVVGNAAHKHRLTSCVIDNLPDVGMKTFPMSLLNEWAGGFDMEDDV